MTDREKELTEALREMIEHFGTPTNERTSASYGKTNKQVVEDARKILVDKQNV